LGIPSRLELELSELKWWENWAELEWAGEGAYLLTSREMPEVFFNRGGLVSCRSPATSIGRLEDRFRTRGVRPAIMVLESCSPAIRTLEHLGYWKADGMTVLAAKEGHAPRRDIEVQIGVARSGDEWSRAYLSAFYGDLGLIAPVGRTVKRLLRSDSATLFEARVGGEVAGVLALYRTNRLAGAYCIGTISEFRNRGIAGELLARAGEVAQSEGRTLVLQALESDGSDRFYLKRGFRELYRKALMQKKDQNCGREDQIPVGP
jgi:GNAT superfamily N-acetyltransferase